MVWREFPFDVLARCELKVISAINKPHFIERISWKPREEEKCIMNSPKTHLTKIKGGMAGNIKKTSERKCQGTSRKIINGSASNLKYNLKLSG